MKKVIGIISIVLSVFITFQSFIAGISNTLSNTGEISGTSGLIVAILMLISGIIILISKYSKGMVITSIVMYILASLIGFSNAGSYLDLNIWSGLCLVFGVLLIYHLRSKKNLYDESKTMIND